MNKAALFTLFSIISTIVLGQEVGDFYGSTDGTESIDLTLGKNGSGSSFKILSSDPGGSTYLKFHGRRWGAGYTWSRESNGGTDKKIAYLYGGGSGQYFQLFHDDQSVKAQFHSNGDTYFNGGNVGIGTNSPSEQLNVYSSSSGVITRFASTAHGGLSGLRVQGKTNDGSDTRFVDFFFDPETYEYGFGAGTNSGQLPISSGLSQADISVDAGGNVSLKGTTTIKGNQIRFSEARGFDYDPTKDAVFFNGYNSGQVAMLSDRYGNGWFAGNVGIGITNPLKSLHISDGSWNNQLQVDRNGNGLSFAPNPSEFYFLPVGETTKVRFNSLDVYVEGSVGIGTTSPSHKLEVAGTIRSKEVKVEATNWPDYVFEPTYNLRTLEETEAYIQSNKHLPEIPSAKEMEANGVQLGEMNMLLLKKIEELTLHLIEVNKENTALRQQLTANSQQLIEQGKMIEALMKKMKDN